MLNRSTHPNTRTMLEAWRRMSANPAGNGLSSSVADDSQLVSTLFVIERTNEGNWVFRSSGDGLTALLGRELAQQPFLDFWSGTDRTILNAVLGAVHMEAEPALIRGRGETLTGQRVEIEIALAPLVTQLKGQRINRILGLYQTLGGEPMLRGRPVWRHRLTAVFPPEAPVEQPGLRLVSDNAS